MDELEEIREEQLVEEELEVPPAEEDSIAKSEEVVDFDEIDTEVLTKQSDELTKIIK